MTWLVFSDVSTRLLWETVSSPQHKQRICKLAMMKRYTMMCGQKYIYGFVRLCIAYHVLAQALLLYVTRLLPRPSNINRGGVWLSETRLDSVDFTLSIDYLAKPKYDTIHE